MTKILTNDLVKSNYQIKNIIKNIEDAYFNIEQYDIPQRHFYKTKDGGDYLVAACTNLETDRYMVRGSSFTPSRKPTVMGHFMLKNFMTGELLAIADGREMVNLRTGAKSAVAAKYLARKSSETLGLIGLGESGKIHAEAIASVLPIKRILGHTRNPENWQTQIDYIKKKTGIDVEIVYKEELIKESDVAVLSTRSTDPLINLPDLTRDGQLIISTAHTEEASKDIPKSEIRTFVDRYEIAKDEFGPVKAALDSGADESIVQGDLAELVKGNVTARKDDSEIIYFQSLGSSHEDMVVLETLFEDLGDQAEEIEV